MTSQYKVLLPLPPFCIKIEREFWGSPIFGFGGVMMEGVAPVESPPSICQYLSIQSFALSVADWSELKCQITASQFDPMFGGFGWTIHTIGPSCTVWPQYTMQQIDRRQTEQSEKAAYAIAAAA